MHRHLPRASGKFISHVLTLITGNSLAQLINVAGTLLLAHLFAPDAFGSFALFVTVVSFLSVLGGARYELAIMLPERDAEAANILILAVLTLFGICGISLLLVAWLHSAVASLLGDPRLSVWLWCAPAAIFANSLYSILCVWYGRMKRFHKVAAARVWQSLGIILGQLALLYIRPGGFALVGGWVLGQTLGTGILAAQLFYFDGKFLSHSIRWAMVREVAKKYRNFPIYKAPYSFVANASSQLIPLILRLFASLSAVGLYSMAARAVYLPVTLIASSMNDVFYEKAATELKHGRLESFVTRLLRIQVVLAAPWLVLAAFDARLVFGLALGPKWVPAAGYAVVLAFASFMFFLTAWLDRLFDIRGHQKLSLILEFSGNFLSVGGLTLALWLHPENTVTAVMIYAAMQVVYSGIWLMFAYRVAEFNVRALLVLLRDAVVSLAVAGLLMGGLHAALHGWPAFLGSALVALGLTAFAFVRYVSTGSAFTSPADRFRQFWADRDSAVTGRDGEDCRREQALELTSLYSAAHPKRVLEIGCGDGSLFPYFGISAACYKGVDFTPKFIERFRSCEPSVQLVCAEGASYLDRAHQYDLILLNGIVQHFDGQMLEQHVQNARTMLRDGGLIIWGSIPRRRHRREYDAGKWSGSGRASAARLLRSWGGRILGLDAMGYWYEPGEIVALADKYGLCADFVPSNLYPYRFHAVIRKPARSGDAQSRSAGAPDETHGFEETRPPEFCKLSAC
jgi:O-antigen/teichoic acid export membrane protein/SAM-dependent methyltransferase